MPKEILCTIGPASMNESVIKRLQELGVSLFRINLSHIKLDDLAETIRFITSHTTVPLSIDTEGAQIRTGDLVQLAFEMRENSVVRVHREPVSGDAEDFNFYPSHIFSELREGDLISIDFNAVLVQVIGLTDEIATLRVINGGKFGRNKAVTVDRPIPMQALTEKDRTAVRIGIDMGIRNFALSFANTGEDVDALRALVGKDATIISKIECRKGFENLDAIAERSDALLIDRGDLSREVPIELIPAYQKTIIAKAKAHDRKVYVATNFLESMVKEPTPTRAEVNDIFNTFLDGADGVVLAAETAIGDYPVRCVQMVVQLINVFENFDTEEWGHYNLDPVSLLVEPHGGELVRRVAASSEVDQLNALPRLEITPTDILDCEQICHGTYSPLTGFMDRDDLESVLTDNRMADGTVWTMPIILQTRAVSAAALAPGQRVALTSGNGKIHAFIDIEQVYALDLERVAKAWFGTESRVHPGVERFYSAGDTAIAGPVTLVSESASSFQLYQLYPAQTRSIFTHKQWSKVVGFHGRNPPHRVHEYIQIQALASTNADGLYISPVIGPTAPGDFLPEQVIKSYQALLSSGIYPEGKVLLGSFATYSRFCGPREAVFTALCRKNMGCSHFIIGREHAGVGGFYEVEAYQDLFQRLGDIGVTPVFFDTIGYDPETKTYTEASKNGAIEAISGTQVRESLSKGLDLPDWLMRNEVQEILRAGIDSGRSVFYEKSPS